MWNGDLWLYVCDTRLVIAISWSLVPRATSVCSWADWADGSSMVLLTNCQQPSNPLPVSCQARTKTRPNWTRMERKIPEPIASSCPVGTREPSTVVNIHYFGFCWQFVVVWEALFDISFVMPKSKPRIAMRGKSCFNWLQGNWMKSMASTSPSWQIWTRSLTQPWRCLVALNYFRMMSQVNLLCGWWQGRYVFSNGHRFNEGSITLCNSHWARDATPLLFCFLQGQV